MNAKTKSEKVVGELKIQWQDITLEVIYEVQSQ